MKMHLRVRSVLCNKSVKHSTTGYHFTLESRRNQERLSDEYLINYTFHGILISASIL